MTDQAMLDTQFRYNRIAPMYDLMEQPVERLAFGRWRERLWSRVEHVRIDRPLVGEAMDALDPLVVRTMGAHINRQTVKNVRRAGLDLDEVQVLAPGGVVRLIVAGRRW